MTERLCFPQKIFRRHPKRGHSDRVRPNNSRLSIEEAEKIPGADMIISRALMGVLLAGSAIAGSTLQVTAQDRVPISFDQPAQDMGDALRAVAARSDRQVYFSPRDVSGLRAPLLKGNLTVTDAIRKLLEGTELTASFSEDRVVIRRQSRTTSADDAPGATDLVVTGTHIRSSEPSSRVISSTREDIEKSGRTDLGAYIRDLPQNFGGGQNPGIAGGGAQGGNENLASTSALNLRGLGPDATLTLINGHRVAYDGAVQGVDISAIPLAALDRIEIVADGSSALYGSDAVGGVANVILRKDFEGLWTSARLGGSTDGGNFQQQYDLVTGGKWQGGGVMIAGDYNRSTALLAGQRSYTQTIDGSTTLIPAQRQYSAVLSGHQDLTPAVEILLDAQYSHRNSDVAFPSTATSNARTNGSLFSPTAESYSVTPSLKFQLPANWQAELSGTLGRSNSAVSAQNFTASTLVSTSGGFYDNRLRAVELRGDGPIFSLPGGDVGLAIGAGYRGFSLRAKSQIQAGAVTTNILDINHRENVEFAYGEISVPLFGSANSRAFADFLQFSAALRYERYEGLASVASPKLGIVYRPVPAITIKGGWGKSFKAPTFYQRYKVYQAVLLNASALGGTGAIASLPVLYLAGGNADLKPERASSWNVAVSYAPPSIPSLRLEINYFNIRYRNRVVNPITSVLGLFDNPIYKNLLTFSPSSALLDELIAPTVGAFGLQNFTGAPYDPAKIYAVVDARSQNTAYQTIQGLDLSGQYRLDLASGDHISFNAAGSYLDSKRRLIEGQTTTPTSGVIFMPPHWRARGGMTWETTNASLSAFANYIGGVDDRRLLPTVRVSAFTSIDLVARISTTPTTGLLQNIIFTAGISNLFNEKPEITRHSSLLDPTYDSTNYPALGRMLSLTIAKRW